MAAAARPPGLGDARMPCPLCGGLIHPVAGRCKHCKEDLSTFRAGRPQAAAPLPTLGGPPAAAMNLPGGTTIHAPVVPVAAITAREGSQPILPQRPTGRSMAAQKAGGSLWRSWPMLVIGVAVLAILTAVVIMFLPPETKGSHKRIGAPPPAPERMDLDPSPKSGQITPPTGADPWGADPSTPPRVNPQPVQPQMPDPDPVDPDDLLGSLNTPGNGAATVMTAATVKFCKKLQTCPDPDATLTTICAGITAATATPAAPTNCPAAQRCLAQIDRFSCDDDATNMTMALLAIPDCKDAITGC